VGARRHSARIGPTAHYTGQTWVRAGLSDPALRTGLGEILHAAGRPVLRAASWLSSGLSLDAYLLQRHRAIDAVLRRAIDRGRVRQVVEVGAGLSPRGLRLVREYGEERLLYLDADLPAMARTKRERLRAAGLERRGLEVVDVDVLSPEGPLALERLVASRLDPGAGTALVLEGLLSYFDAATVRALLGRSARLLRGFPAGLLVASLELEDEAGRYPAARALVVFLQAFTGGSVRLTYPGAAEARAEIEAAGFARVEVHRPADLLGPQGSPQVVRIAEAWA
jgi:O-methyltransferase involved in polyketide biosynthesis